MTEANSHGRTRCTQITYGSPEYAATVELRDEILRKPLGLRLSDEQLQAERSDHHLACYRDGRLIACLVLTPGTDGTVRMRQVAVATDCQRQGIGRMLISHAERFAAGLGYLGISLRTLTEWMQRHIVPYIKISHRVCLFSRNDLDAAMGRFRLKAVGE